MKSTKIDKKTFYKDATPEKLAKALLRPVKLPKRKRFPEEPEEGPKRKRSPDKPSGEG